MSSPQDNWNNPYRKSPQSQSAYPSTVPSLEGGFIPLSFSSPNPQNLGNKQSGSNNYRQNWNNYQRNRGYAQRDYRNRGGGGGGDGESPSNTRKRYSGPGNKDDISNYIHPSMFEDPWKELVQQNDAKMKINEAARSDEEKGSPTESGESSDGDGREVE